MATAVFEELGSGIERRWRDANYAEGAFAAISATHLEEFRLPEKVTAWDAIGFTLNDRLLPTQRDLAGAFGDPPVTLWNSARFHIDIYFWMNGTTSIHQHGFCGAFQVLMGSSVHSTFDFERAESINQAMETGRIALRDVELLTQGDVRQIRAGRQFIHSLFHLDQPSATIVVRTYLTPIEAPQFDYRQPYLALDPFFREQNLSKQLQVVSLLYRARRADADDQVAAFLATLDFQSTFMLLQQVRGLVGGNNLDRLFDRDKGSERFDRFLDVARGKHGALVDLLPPVFAHHDVTAEIMRRRNYVTNPDHRFLLALLLNVTGRERILGLVAAKYPGEAPAERVIDWISELGTTRIAGSSLPNALGLANFGDADVALVETLLKGASPDQAGGADPAAIQRVTDLRNNVVLRPLLVD